MPKESEFDKVMRELRNAKGMSQKEREAAAKRLREAEAQVKRQKKRDENVAKLRKRKNHGDGDVIDTGMFNS